jgi:hypothetical protein
MWTRYGVKFQEVRTAVGAIPTWSDEVREERINEKNEIRRGIHIYIYIYSYIFNIYVCIISLIFLSLFLFYLIVLALYALL